MITANLFFALAACVYFVSGTGYELSKEFRKALKDNIEGIKFKGYFMKGFVRTATNSCSNPRDGGGTTTSFRTRSARSDGDVRIITASNNGDETVNDKNKKNNKKQKNNKKDGKGKGKEKDNAMIGEKEKDGKEKEGKLKRYASVNDKPDYVLPTMGNIREPLRREKSKNKIDILEQMRLCAQKENLRSVVESKNVGEIRRAVANVQDVNIPDAKEQTLLHVAAHRMDPSIAAVLLLAGATLEFRDIWGETPFLTAVRHENEPVARFFLHCGANVNETNAKRESCLHYGTRTSLQFLEFLLTTGVATDLRDMTLRTALDAAVRKQACQPTILALLESGCEMSSDTRFQLLRQWYQEWWEAALHNTVRYADFEQYLTVNAIKTIVAKNNAYIWEEIEEAVRTLAQTPLYALSVLLEPTYQRQLSPDVETRTKFQRLKMHILKTIAQTISEGTYMGTISRALAADVFCTLPYYAWKMKKLAFAVALAAYVTNTPVVWAVHLTQMMTWQIFPFPPNGNIINSENDETF